jgi:hypothetical protein
MCPIAVAFSRFVVLKGPASYVTETRTNQGSTFLPRDKLDSLQTIKTFSSLYVGLSARDLDSSILLYFYLLVARWSLLRRLRARQQFLASHLFDLALGSCMSAARRAMAFYTIKH